MRRVLPCIGLVALALLLGSHPNARAACCYFGPPQVVVLQPSQEAFITWNPGQRMEAFTVEPHFTGSAKEFGMVVPTPSRPRVYEMPREFFKELDVFTKLRPADPNRYQQGPPLAAGEFGGGGLGGFGGGGAGGFGGARLEEEPPVRVVEGGVVGSLDYKILVADDARALYDWLKDSGYAFSGDEATLDFYISQKWYFTVMKVDPTQMKSEGGGGFNGRIAPTCFAFTSSHVVYPLRITQISVKGNTDLLLYVQASTKMDLNGDRSYQGEWEPLWIRAYRLLLPEMATPQERRWKPVVDQQLGYLNQRSQSAGSGISPTELRFAKMLNARDMAMLDGRLRFDRTADLQSRARLRVLRGHLQQGQWLTKLHKVFSRAEMTDDLELGPALLGGWRDEMEYTDVLPQAPIPAARF